MGDAHIARLQAIGIGKESTAGTQVAAAAWIPKQSGALKPGFETADDSSGYGVIDEIFNTETVKNKTEITLNGILRDGWLGYLMLAAFGQEKLCVCIEITGQSGGTPAKGDNISSATGSWAGTIRKVILVGAVTYYFVETTSGTIDAQTDVTNGTWTGGTSVVNAGVYGHFFSRLNTNNHPTFTIYGSDEVADEYATYCMLASLDVELAVGNFGTFNSSWMGKKLVAASPQTPGYASDNAFLAKHGAVKFAADEASLNAASAAANLTRFKLSILKNLTEIQAFGSDDIDSIHNQQYAMAGDFDATYKDETYRDYVADATKKAARFQMINSNVTALLDDAANSIYPSLYLDLAKAAFKEWDRSDDNNAIVSQTCGFGGEYSVPDSMTGEALLINDRATAY